MYAGSNLLHSTKLNERRARSSKGERHVGLKNIKLEMHGSERCK